MKGLNVRGVTEFCRSVVLRPQLLLPQVSVKGASACPLYALCCCCHCIFQRGAHIADMLALRMRKPPQNENDADSLCGSMCIWVSAAGSYVRVLYCDVAADLNEVSFQALKDRGFQGVIFDKDNTLTLPHHHEIAAHLQVRASAQGLILQEPTMCAR